MTRKGYKTIEQQVAANKRYLEKNPGAKERAKISDYKSKAKKFVLEFASTTDLEELQELINKKLKED